MKIKIKNSWEDITLKEFNQLLKLNVNPDNSDVENLIEILSVISDKSKEELLDMDASFVMSLMKEIDFIDTDIKKGLPKQSYILNGTEYEVNMNIGSLKAGQWIDIVNWTKRNDKNEALDDFLAVIMKPKGSEYNIETYYESLKDIYEYMSVKDASDISTFFLTNYESIIKGLASYLEKQMKKGSKKLTSLKKKELESLIQKLKDLTKDVGTL